MLPRARYAPVQRKRDTKSKFLRRSLVAWGARVVAHKTNVWRLIFYVKMLLTNGSVLIAAVRVVRIVFAGE